MKNNLLKLAEAEAWSKAMAGPSRARRIGPIAKAVHLSSAAWLEHCSNSRSYIVWWGLWAGFHQPEQGRSCSDGIGGQEAVPAGSSKAKGDIRWHQLGEVGPHPSHPQGHHRGPNQTSPLIPPTYPIATMAQARGWDGPRHSQPPAKMGWEEAGGRMKRNGQRKW